MFLEIYRFEFKKLKLAIHWMHTIYWFTCSNNKWVINTKRNVISIRKLFGSLILIISKRIEPSISVNDFKYSYNIKKSSGYIQMWTATGYMIIYALLKCLPNVLINWTAFKSVELFRENTTRKLQNTIVG